MNAHDTPEAHLASAAGPPRRGYVQRRLHSFGLTMIVMAVSFVFYYLGLFGGIDGPLNPGRVGESLAGLGVTRTDILVLLLVMTGIALSWNWVYNAFCQAAGRRMACTLRLKGGREYCGASARRAGDGRYVCSAGHRRPEARFVPVRKGTVAHCVWILFLSFCVIVLYST